MADLAGLVCSLYKGAKPVQCKTLSALSNTFIEKNWREEEDRIVATPADSFIT